MQGKSKLIFWIIVILTIILQVITLVKMFW